MPLLAFAATCEDVGYLLENRDPAREPRLTFHEIYRVERKGMGMYGTVEGNPGFAEGGLDRARGVRSSKPDSEMVARAEALARWIREHREAFACSQQEFARESGISRATLSKVEQGHIYPSMQVRRKLAKALGFGPQELWNFRPEDITDRGEESTKQAS